MPFVGYQRPAILHIADRPSGLRGDRPWTVEVSASVEIEGITHAFTLELDVYARTKPEASQRALDLLMQRLEGVR